MPSSRHYAVCGSWAGHRLRAFRFRLGSVPIGVTTGHDGQVVAGTALAALMDRYHDIAVDESNPEDLRLAAATLYEQLHSLGEPTS
jgi:hypothetical protein